MQCHVQGPAVSRDTASIAADEYITSNKKHSANVVQGLAKRHVETLFVDHDAVQM